MPSNRTSFGLRCSAGATAAGIFMLFAVPAVAQTQLPEGPWRLDNAASAMNFVSVKKGSVVEVSSFAGFEGEIRDDGSAEVTVVLESVDTKVDLRNVRMRFLFFETYKYPIATISAKVDPAAFAALPKARRMRHDLAYTLSLHGATKEFTSPVNVTLIDNDTVSISSAQPVVINIADFGFEAGLKKLQEAVGDIIIVPATSVTFDMVFHAGDGGLDPIVMASAQVQPAALESAGELTPEECRNRFEVLSRTEAIYFRSGSATLDDERSGPLLDTVVDIAKRCPDLKIEIAGYTDSDGPSSFNQLLSEKRAGTVAYFLQEKGVPADQLVDVGYGEANPVFSNDSAENKRRNRRIEFHIRG